MERISSDAVTVYLDRPAQSKTGGLKCTLTGFEVSCAARRDTMKPNLAIAGSPATSSTGIRELDGPS